MCLRDRARASGLGCRDYSAHLCDSASDPARGLGATYDTACLRDLARASGPGRRDYSARLRDSASDPAWGMGTTYDPACLRDPARASGPGRRDYSTRLRDSASDPTWSWASHTTRHVSATQPGPQGLDAATTQRVSVTPPGTLGPGRRNHLESHSDSNQGFRVRETSWIHILRLS